MISFKLLTLNAVQYRIWLILKFSQVFTSGVFQLSPMYVVGKFADQICSSRSFLMHHHFVDQKKYWLDIKNNDWEQQHSFIEYDMFDWMHKRYWLHICLVWLNIKNIDCMSVIFDWIYINLIHWILLHMINHT